MKYRLPLLSKAYLLIGLVLSLVLAANLTFAQNPGEIDLDFNTTDKGFGYPGATGTVRAALLQPDGKTLIGGRFDRYDRFPRSMVARLNTDRSLDTTFVPGTGNGIGFSAEVLTMLLQPDGKVVIGGSFTTDHGHKLSYLARLYTDGSLDTVFSSGVGPDATICTALFQPDGKIIIGGHFASYNGVARNRIARLNENGSIDESFDPNTGSNNLVRASVLQPDGKIIISEEFIYQNLEKRDRLTRLNSDGSIDTSFNSGTGAMGPIYSIVLLPNGKIIIGGEFAAYNGIARNRIARLNADGTLDTSFEQGAGADGTILTISLQPNGKLLVGGEFKAYDNTIRNRIVRLNTNGRIDFFFNPGTGANFGLYTTLLQADGKILIAGGFTVYNGLSRHRIAWIHEGGSLDEDYEPGTGANHSVRAAVLHPDGKIVVGGGFTAYNGIASNRLVRINSDGILDQSFAPRIDASNVSEILLQADGKYLVNGYFVSNDGLLRYMVVRLHANGSLDYSFNSGTGANYNIRAIALQTDGKIVLGGDFTTYNGVAYNRITRLNADGSLDNSFNSGAGVGGVIQSIAIQPDTKIVIAGGFTTYNNIQRSRIAKLNPDGSLDATFNPGIGANNWVTTMAVQPDGKTVIAGSFTAYNGLACNGITRLNVDGTLDESFGHYDDFGGAINSLALQDNGKIIIAGNFTSFNEIKRNRIARLNVDGSLDESFSPGTGASATIYKLVLQPDGKIIISGDFTSYDGTGRNYIARIYGGEASPSPVLRIVEKKLTHLSVFPNPVSGNVFINADNLDSASKVTLKMTGLDGRTVLSSSGNLEAATDHLNSYLATAASGIYILQMVAGGRVLTTKLVKQ
jgi:uncharacterized delta-60 repeat protein